MRACRTTAMTTAVLTAFLVLLLGCRRQPPAPPPPVPLAEAPAGAGPAVTAMQVGAAAPDGKSDLEKVRAADVSILFVGNSHTTMHDLPSLVCKMIEFRHPEKKTYAHYIPVGWLEEVARDPRCKDEIESRPWKYVVLQAQKISVSGKVEYSRKEGIEIAKLAKAKGAGVFFFVEWGLKGVAGDGLRQTKIYQEMARAADVNVLPIAAAWDLALAQRPDLPLYIADGNHQSALGAFLTACVIAGRLTGESPVPLAAFAYPAGDEKDRKLLADTAAKALADNPVNAEN